MAKKKKKKISVTIRKNYILEAYVCSCEFSILITGFLVSSTSRSQLLKQLMILWVGVILRMRPTKYLEHISPESQTWQESSLCRKRKQ